MNKNGDFAENNNLNHLSAMVVLLNLKSTANPHQDFNSSAPIQLSLSKHIETHDQECNIANMNTTK